MKELTFKKISPFWASFPLENIGLDGRIFFLTDQTRKSQVIYIGVPENSRPKVEVFGGKEKPCKMQNFALKQNEAQSKCFDALSCEAIAPKKIR